MHSTHLLYSTISIEVTQQEVSLVKNYEVKITNNEVKTTTQDHSFKTKSGIWRMTTMIYTPKTIWLNLFQLNCGRSGCVTTS